MPLPPDTTLGRVRLAVRDLDGARSFYETAIGLRALETAAGGTVLGAGDRPIVELVAEPDGPERPPDSTGLFHLAVLVPERADLAAALRRVADAGWRLQGASDHLVSEALYLADPEGNGIELYRDRPREQWPRRDGEIAMATLPLDLRDLAAAAEPSAAAAPMPDGTRLGHVHLQVADLAEAEAFTCGRLGFEPTVRTYPGALFVAAGGYHHHLGLNVWRTQGAPPPPPGALGLRAFEVLAPGAPDRTLTDPHGIEVVVRGNTPS